LRARRPIATLSLRSGAARRAGSGGGAAVDMAEETILIQLSQRRDRQKNRSNGKRQGATTPRVGSVRSERAASIGVERTLQAVSKT
jgi:hypothetical protein